MREGEKGSFQAPHHHYHHGINNSPHCEPSLLRGAPHHYGCACASHPAAFYAPLAPHCYLSGSHCSHEPHACHTSCSPRPWGCQGGDNKRGVEWLGERGSKEGGEWALEGAAAATVGQWLRDQGSGCLNSPCRVPKQASRTRAIQLRCLQCHSCGRARASCATGLHERVGEGGRRIEPTRKSCPLNPPPTPQLECPRALLGC